MTKLLLSLLFLAPCGCTVTPPCVKQHRAEPWSDLRRPSEETAEEASFDQLLDESERETDTEFCKKATEAWQVSAFCHKGTR